MSEPTDFADDGFLASDAASRDTQSPVTRYAMATMEEIARRLNLPEPPKVTREARLTAAAIEAVMWLDAHAPGRARETLQTALDDCKKL